ncbi:hypothetical protein B0H11DRAFT_2039651 [Mycena galericulata]|nr:hypothetical protein B0H11DRAFT_2039651 [Mycena galericulata]
MFLGPRSASGLSRAQQLAADFHLIGQNSSASRSPSLTDDEEILPPLARQRLRARTGSSSSTDRAREVIFCGAEQPFTTESFHEHDSGLPTTSLGIGIERALHGSRAQKPIKSNGCGTEIHSSAIPMHGIDGWTGHLAGVATCVIPLESKYMPKEMAERMATPGEDACGCSYGFVGCAVCGNPLGMLFRPCDGHRSENVPAIYSFVSAAVSPPLPPPPPPAPPVPEPSPVLFQAPREPPSRRARASSSRPLDPVFPAPQPPPVQFTAAREPPSRRARAFPPLDPVAPTPRIQSQLHRTVLPPPSFAALDFADLPRRQPVESFSALDPLFSRTWASPPPPPAANENLNPNPNPPTPIPQPDFSFVRRELDAEGARLLMLEIADMDAVRSGALPAGATTRVLRVGRATRRQRLAGDAVDSAMDVDVGADGLDFT